MNRLARINPSIPAVASLLWVTAVLRWVNLSGSPARLDDEGTYVAQAYAVIQWGELAHYTYWYDHPPAGWLQLALWMVISGPDFGGNAVTAGRCLMVIVAVITGFLVWTLARRLRMSRWASAAAVAIFALSPLAISLSRTVYLDNLAVCWLLGALVLVCSPRHRLSAMFGAAACFGIAVLTKETMLLLLPTFAWLIWTKAAPVTRRYALAVCVAVFGIVLSTYILMAALRGELVPGPGHVSLWQGIKFQLWERAAGGAINDAGSLKRHTINEWLQLDPALPLLAAPIALSALFVDRLRPFAVTLLLLVAIVLRPGYLPVPFVITALPLIAVLAAGVGEVALRRAFQFAMRHAGPLGTAPATPVVYRDARMGAVAAGCALLLSTVVSLWLPSYSRVLTADDDGSMRQAQEWIKQNVPKADRMIVDDALWVDLIRDGRDRRNVVWAYKVDTDEQVRAWSPHGWKDYEWVVSTASLRANTPSTGVLTDAIAHARPAATFRSEGRRVDVLHVDNGSAASKPVPPAAPAAGVQLATRLAAAADPQARGALQSRTVDQRVIATLAVIAAAEPVQIKSISRIEGEDDAGSPRRQFTLTGPPARLSSLVAFFQRQVGPFAPESVALTPKGLTVRFPVRSEDTGIGASPPWVQDAPASLRVADMRRNRPPNQLNFVRIDGSAAGSLDMGAGTNLSEYRSMPAGTYVMTTTLSGATTPVIRQVVTVRPGASYTLGLFSAGESERVVAQLAPDGPPGGPSPAPALRLLHAASAAGPVKLALQPADGDATVLADRADYGLISGYAPMTAGQYDAVVTADGRDTHQPVELLDGQPTTLLLTDGPDGPALQPLRDLPDAPVALDPPTLAMPRAGVANEKTPSKLPVVANVRQKTIPVALCLLLSVGAVVLGVKMRARPTR